jgi:hypothetical protein
MWTRRQTAVALERRQTVLAGGARRVGDTNRQQKEREKENAAGVFFLKLLASAK